MTMKKSAIVLTVVVIGLLCMQFAWLSSATGRTDKPDFARSVNLALRRTAHHLLREAGDSTSRIPAVQRPDATTFEIRLAHAFNYGRLPALLQQSLMVHGINDDYDVAVLDCSTNELLLGYNVDDVRQQNGVPCLGRDQKKGCYTFQVSFARSARQHQPGVLGWAGVVGLMLLAGAYLFWQKTNAKGRSALKSDTASYKSESLIEVGKLTFNLTNQTVEVAGIRQTLTYREAKLLHLFLRYPNQLLERDFILKSVWEDEGIIVSRSVDVFVSRLRKLLQPDPALRLVAVHGVGYRLEVQAV